jgi:hypothetical protein
VRGEQTGNYFKQHHYPTGHNMVMASTTADNASGKPRRKRRWLQFGLPTLLALITLSAVVLGLIAAAAERQRRAVAAIDQAGGWVLYDYEDPPPGAVDHELPGPDWLCRLVGVHYFADVTIVELPDRAPELLVVHLVGLTSLELLHLCGTQVTDAGLVHLEGLTGLQALDLNSTGVSYAGLVHLKALTGLQWLELGRTQVTDEGLVHLKGLTEMEWLWLADTHVSDDGLADLRASLPNCVIDDGP